MRSSIGGWVANRFLSEPFGRAGTMKKAFIAAALRRSRLGTRSIVPLIFSSADDNALGRPVSTAAPRSAAYSR